MDNKKIKIITGHYGSGKTTFAVNLAINEKKNGENVTIVDLDIVNPFFRTADNQKMLEDLGIKVIVPLFSNSNLETLALSAEVQSVFHTQDTVIIDVGGDDDGATALGRYNEMIKKQGYIMYCTASCYRPMTQNIEDSAEVIRDIEAASRLKIDYLVNTSSLGEETDKNIILDSIDYIDSLCKATKIPLAYNVVKSDIIKDFSESELKKMKNIYPVEIYTKKLF